MSVNDYIPDGEIVVSSCTGDKWQWYCTPTRLIRFKEERNQESFHDLSLSEISGISIGKEEKEEGMMAILLGVVLFVIGLGIYLVDSGGTFEGIGLLLAVLGVAVFIIGVLFQATGEVNIEFRGPGLLAEEDWEIDADPIENPDEIREFVIAVHEQIRESDGQTINKDNQKNETISESLDE